MSVALVYKPVGYSPIASQSFFEKFWKPGIESLSLDCLPLFESGFDVTFNEISNIQAELDVFKDWSKTHHDQDTYSFIEERVDLLNEHFSLIDWDINDKVFIG